MEDRKAQVDSPVSAATGGRGASWVDGNAVSSDHARTLQRILAAVEQNRRQGRLELALVIVLSLTALGSTWCAYQSQLWNGKQLVGLVDADFATQEAEENTLAAMQRRTQDGMITLHFMEAIQRNDAKAMQAMLRRMPSPLREAMDASLALDPLKNPDVPGPLKMPQYVLVEDQRAETARTKAINLRAAAHQAGQNGDSYVLLTLLFASVLFFGGITSTFQARRLRVGLASIACVMFIAIVIRVASMPVCGG